MLVLSRKVGEIITVGNSISITVVSNDRRVFGLGIDAPRDISVHRKEVYDKIIEMNRQAAQTKVSALKHALQQAVLICWHPASIIRSIRIELSSPTKRAVNNYTLSIKDKK